MKSQYLTSCCRGISFQEKIFNSQHFAEAKPSKLSWWQILYKNTFISTRNSSLHVSFLSNAAKVLIWNLELIQNLSYLNPTKPYNRKFVPQTGKLRHGRHKRVTLAPFFFYQAAHSDSDLLVWRQMSLWEEWKPNVAGILGITFTAENTNLAKNRKCTPQKIVTPFTSKVPDFIRLLTHVPSLPPWFLNKWKPKITCKLPPSPGFDGIPQVQSLAWLGKQLGPRQPFAFQGRERDGSASQGGPGAEMRWGFTRCHATPTAGFTEKWQSLQ